MPVIFIERFKRSLTTFTSRPHADLLTLALIVAMGLALRLNALTSFGIWFDEAYHIALVKLPGVPQMLDAVLSNPPSDPLYVLLLRPWVLLFGHGDAAVRLLSVIFGTAILPATYWLGRNLASREAGLLGALGFALSPYGVEFGQQAALYSLAVLTTTLALAAGWRLVNTGRGPRLYVLLGVVAIYSHYVVAVILALFAALAWFGIPDRRVRLRTWLLAHFAIFALWLPWLLLIITHWLSTELPRASLVHYATWAELGKSFIQYTTGSAALNTQSSAVQWSGLLAGVLLLLLGVSLCGSPGRRLRVMLALSAILFFTPALVSARTGLWLFVSHFMLFLLPTLMLVAAAGAIHLVTTRSKFSPLRNYLGAGLLTVFLGAQIVGLSLYYRYPPHGNDGLRQLAAVLREQAQPGEPVLVTPPALMPSLQQYYDSNVHGLPSDFDPRAVYLPYEPTRWNNESLQSLETHTAAHSRFWLLYRLELDQDCAFLSTLQSRYNQVRETTYDFAILYAFERK